MLEGLNPVSFVRLVPIPKAYLIFHGNIPVFPVLLPKSSALLNTIVLAVESINKFFIARVVSLTDEFNSFPNRIVHRQICLLCFWWLRLSGRCQEV